MEKTSCLICHNYEKIVSKTLEVCVDCFRNKPDSALSYSTKAHNACRFKFELPLQPPKFSNGIQCRLCSNECRIRNNEKGYCGLRYNKAGQIQNLSGPEHSLLHVYKDPHITNCCSSWFCPAGTGIGYPRFTKKDKPEVGYNNLAVFFYGCNFDCLFCQNSSHKRIEQAHKISKNAFKEIVFEDEKITCICFFGGSPEPQLPFAISTARELVESNPNRILRICFEWNGCGNQQIVRQAAELAHETGGNLKFDIKCFDENLSIALCGVSNKRTFENFSNVTKEFFNKRPDAPNITATTLLVPGYVDQKEVESIAQFIGELDPNIPYSLLVFHPDFEMNDLPITPIDQVRSCHSTAKKYLNHVNIGNKSLLRVGSIM
ncbi:radical SAM protein [[Eubacterium] cellulosolvens]